MRRNVWAGLSGFCLLAGSTWVFGAYAASTWPDLMRVCVHEGVVFVVLLGVGLARSSRPGGRVLVALAGWGAALFALPAVMAAGAGGHLGSLTGLLVFGLVPFLTVFLRAQRVGGDLGLLMPGAIGFGGLALVVPFGWPSSGEGAAWLVGMTLAAGLVASAGIRMHGLMQEAPVAWAGAAGSGGAALLAGAAWFVFERGRVELAWRAVGMEVGWGLLVDLPLVLLMVWLVRAMQPEGFSARFLMVPLVTIVGGLLVIRPEVVWTTWLGLALVSGASWMLVSNRDESVNQD